MSRKERKINFSEFLAAGPEEAGLLIINTPISSKKGEQWAMTKVVFEVDDSIKLNSLCYDSWATLLRPFIRDRMNISKYSMLHILIAAFFLFIGVLDEQISYIYVSVIYGFGVPPALNFYCTQLAKKTTPFNHDFLMWLCMIFFFEEEAIDIYGTGMKFEKEGEKIKNTKDICIIESVEYDELTGEELKSVRLNPRIRFDLT